MKKVLIAMMLVLTVAPTFAQVRVPPPFPRPVPPRVPRIPPPIPRPVPRPTPFSCHVFAVDRFNRVLATFFGHTDFRTGLCLDALRLCNFEIRRLGWFDARCVQPLQ